MESFISDPKLIVAIFALLISIINYVTLSWYRWDQNKKWEALNIAKVELDEVYFIAWEEFDLNVALTRNWGYKPSIFSIVEDKVHKSKYRKYEELILWDLEKKARVDGSNGFHIVEQGIHEGERLGLINQKLTIMKHMQMQIDLKNRGTTIAKNINITVDLMNDSPGLPKRIFKSLSQVDLYNGSSININMDIYLPKDVYLPIPTKFILNLNFISFADRREYRTIPIEYDPNRNY